MWSLQGLGDDKRVVEELDAGICNTPWHPALRQRCGVAGYKTLRREQPCWPHVGGVLDEHPGHGFWHWLGGHRTRAVFLWLIEETAQGDQVSAANVSRDPFALDNQSLYGGCWALSCVRGLSVG